LSTTAHHADRYARTNEDLSWLGLIAKARGDVRDGPDCGIIKSAFEAVASVANPWAMPIPKPMSCPHRRHVSVKAPIDASSILSWGGNGAAPVVSFFGIHVTTHLRQRGGHSAPDLADQPPIWRVVKANLKFSLKKSFCIGLTVERCSHIVYRPDFAFHFAFSVSTADTDFADATCSLFRLNRKPLMASPTSRRVVGRKLGIFSPSR
jgi:hypothetical protein